jgi:hypothetical protein
MRQHINDTTLNATSPHLLDQLKPLSAHQSTSAQAETSLALTLASLLVHETYQDATYTSPSTTPPSPPQEINS